MSSLCLWLNAVRIGVIFPVETFYVFYIGGWVLEALVGRLYLGVEKVIDV